MLFSRPAYMVLIEHNTNPMRGPLVIVPENLKTLHRVMGYWSIIESTKLFCEINPPGIVKNF